MSLALALDIVMPGAEYTGSLTNDTQDAYDRIVWLDARPKPTFEKVLAASAQVFKNDLKTFAAKLRFSKQRKGFIYRGSKFHSDPQAVMALTAAVTLAKANTSYSVQWKLYDGTFLSLDANGLIAAFNAVVKYVETLYGAENTVGAAIDAGNVTEHSQVIAAINSVPSSV
jgi:hypothetical protein